MANNEMLLRETLAGIADMANAAIEKLDEHEHEHGHESDEAPEEESEVLGRRSRAQEPHCVPKKLPNRLLQQAAEAAKTINPMNGLSFGPTAAAGLSLDPMKISVLVGKYWGPSPRQLTVSSSKRPLPISEHVSSAI